MSKKRPTIGENGFVLPVLPPERDPRLWTRMVRVTFFTPGFVALLLIKAGEPAAFADVSHDRPHRLRVTVAVAQQVGFEFNGKDRSVLADVFLFV